MNRKAQIVGQVFIFILAAALAVLIIGYGYGAIKNFISKTEQISYINFKTDLERDIKSTSSDYGTIKKAELFLPAEFDKLCLIDQSYQENKDNTCLCGSICPSTKSEEVDYNPAVCDAWKTENYEENAFLVSGTAVESFEVGVIEFDIDENGYLCITPTGNKIILRLEGLGNRVKITKWI